MASQQQRTAIAAAIETIASNLPIRNVDYGTRIKVATKLVKAVFKNNKKLNAKSAINRGTLLRIAETIADNPSKSHTPGPSSDLGNQPVKDKIPPASKYQTKDQCISGVIGENPAMSSTAASAFCDQIFGNSQKQAQRRQASTMNKVPAFVSAITGGNPPDLPSSGTEINVRSAAVANYNQALYGSTISDILERQRVNKVEAIASKNRILSAKKSSEAPGWVRSLDILSE